jgi:antitoxin YefM
MYRKAATMTTLTATSARREFFDLIKNATTGHRTFRIQHRRGTAVLMSEDDYEGLLETLELLAVPGFRDSIKRSIKQMQKGETTPLSEVFGE